MFSRFFIFLILLTGLCLSACSPMLSIQAQASDRLNVDEKNNSLPVSVHVYQLSNIDKFESANFDELWLNYTSILGNTLLAENEFSLNPKEERVIKFHQEKNAHYIGVVAIFRMPSNQHWRVIEKLADNVSYSGNKIYLRVEENHIFLKEK
jgi:type VI secretion system VasD/TssJ family lipoprotein